MTSQRGTERGRGAKESGQVFAVLRARWPLAFPAQSREVRPLASSVTGEIEAMRATIATRAEPELEPAVDIATPARPPHILPYFEDVDSGYLHWVLRNIDNDQVRATARYHLDLRAALARRNDQEAIKRRGPRQRQPAA
jgi:hypothetical protein